MKEENQEQIGVEDAAVEWGASAAESDENVEPAVAVQDTASIVEEVAEPTEADEIALLTEELQAVRAQAAEYLDGWQRSRAEFANYRRRQDQRQKQMDTEAKSRVLSHLLPVVDDLERAFSAVPQEIGDNSWVSGLRLVWDKLMGALTRDGLSVLPVEPGDAFDPNVHEALTHEPCADFGESIIIQVVQQGYKLDDMVLRPALVRVSSDKTADDQVEDACCAAGEHE